MERLFEQFEAASGHILLFLNHVTEVELLVWEKDASAPILRRRVSLSGPELAHRGEIATRLRKELDAWSSKTKLDWRTEPTALTDAMASMNPASFPRRTIRIAVDVAGGRGPSSRREWWVRSGVGQGESWRMAADPQNAGRRCLWSAASVAVPVHSTDGGCDAPEGRAFATLPTPIVTGLPVSRPRHTLCCYRAVGPEILFIARQEQQSSNFDFPPTVIVLLRAHIHHVAYTPVVGSHRRAVGTVGQPQQSRYIHVGIDASAGRMEHGSSA